MYCGHCGAQVMSGQLFCNKCGQAISGASTPASMATPAPPLQSSSSPTSLPAQTSPSAGFAPRSRVARHVSVLGALWIALSVLRLIPGVALMAFSHMHFPFMFMPIPAQMRLFLAPFLGMIGLVISGFAIAGVIAGWGLLVHAPWARMLAIVLGCISLIHFPLGTALGIYTLWVLIPEHAEAEYQRLTSVG